MKEKSKLGSAPNLKAAASRLGCPVEMLRDAKNSGCKAFSLRGSVDCDAFKVWLEGQPEFAAKWQGEGAVPNKAVSDAWKAHFEHLEKKRRYEEKMGRLVPYALVGQRLRTLATQQKAIAEAEFTDPVKLAEFCGLMQGLVKEWSQAK